MWASVEGEAEEGEIGIGVENGSIMSFLVLQSRKVYVGMGGVGEEHGLRS